MEMYLEALDIWEAIEEVYEVYEAPALPINLTMAQIKAHKEKACLFAVVSSTIFLWIMSLKLAKET